MFRTTAVSMMLAELTGVIAVLIDGIFTSRFLGVDAYSGISLVKPFSSIVLLVAGFFSTGCNVVCSQLVGKGEKKAANEAFNLSVFLSFAVGLILLILCAVSPTTVLSLCGISLDKYPELLPHIYGYLRGFMIGIPALILIQVLAPILVMQGGKRVFTISSIILCAADIIGDFLNALVFHGGAFGMGLATSAAYIIQAVIIVIYFLRHNSYFSFSLKAMKLRQLPELAKNGTPALVKKLASTVRDIFLNYIYIMVTLVAAAIAARGIQGDLFEFLYCIPIGLGRTLITMVGIYYSADDKHGLKHLYLYSFRMGLIMSGIAGAAVFIAAPWLAGIYSSDPEVLSYAVFSIRWMAVALIFFTIISLVLHYFQGIGNLKRANLLSIGERFVVPVVCAAVLGMLFGSRGILASVAITEIILVLILFISVIIHCKGLPKKWEDIMFLPKDFGGSDNDNIYAEIRTIDDAIQESKQAEDFCLSHHTGEREAKLMGLFVEEMAVSVLERTPDRPVTIDFRLFVHDEKICFSMMDLSEQFNPTMFYEIHEEEDEEKYLGIRLVMDMAKEVRYQSTYKNNTLTVVLT